MENQPCSRFNLILLVPMGTHGPTYDRGVGNRENQQINNNKRRVPKAQVKFLI